MNVYNKGMCCAMMYTFILCASHMHNIKRIRCYVLLATYMYELAVAAAQQTAGKQLVGTTSGWKTENKAHQ